AEAAKADEKILSAKYDLEDYVAQINQIKKMGPLNELFAMIPGFKQISRELTPEMTERQMKRVEAIINSMTREERRRPDLLNASRKRRIAKGSGTEVQEINQLLKQFRDAQTLMKQLSNNPRMRGLGGLMGRR
ncbi:MAG: signal recognition particle protein, partial [Candidatus Roseilinea sp.]